ncbi:putative efflux pump kojT [Pseudocercospora fuligena]|uniref:Putative efflux pump kojT n=1 Tax=Pseudocercospora fuligena TaxID=685502 RepID=A0A8H6VFU8_9PEZI|nr:putative efflux pump kojT [Pseudocercospora fuligena]
MQSILQRQRMRERFRDAHPETLNGEARGRSKECPSTIVPFDVEKSKNVNDERIWAGLSTEFSPRNWSWSSKVFYTTCVGLTGLLVSGASASNTEIVPQAARQYLPSEIGPDGSATMRATQIELMSITLYLAAFGMGTIVSGPLSETFGRNPVYITSLTIFGLFTLGSALSPNITSQLVCRFFMGLFGSPPNVTMGGSIADMWTPAERTWIFPALSAMIFCGPFLSPVFADLIATSEVLSWHSIEWITLIFTGIVLVLIVLFLPETYAPVLIRWQAEAFEGITGQNASQASQRTSTLRKRISDNMRLPWLYLLHEPIVFSLSLYLVLIYSILFGFLPGFTYIFGTAASRDYPHGIYGWSQKKSSLAFLPLSVGFLLSFLPLLWIYPRYKRKLARGTMTPEERLLSALIGAPLLPASILWLGYTSRPETSVWSPLAANVLFGFASIMIFNSCYSYVIDAYEAKCSSALVGMTVTRYVAAAFMVHAAVPMYERLGVEKSLLWMGIVSAFPMGVVPFAFWKYGPVLRRRSRFGVWAEGDG